MLGLSFYSGNSYLRNSAVVTLTAACFLTICASAGFAQTSSGSLTGTVLDAQGSAVPNATVVVTDLAKQTSFHVITENSGRFAFPTLAPARTT